jgi:hypothetical protein
MVEEAILPYEANADHCDQHDNCLELFQQIFVVSQDAFGGDSLVCLVARARRQVVRIKAAMQEPQPQLEPISLVCRTLFETKVFIQYCLKSKANAVRFKQDAGIDACELERLIIKCCDKFTEEERQEQLAGIAAHDDKFKKQIGGTKRLDARLMAEKLGYTNYSDYMKLFSKSLHTCGWSTFPYLFPDLRVFRNILIRHAHTLLKEIVAIIREHCEKYGGNPETT